MNGPHRPPAPAAGVWVGSGLAGWSRWLRRAWRGVRARPRAAGFAALLAAGLAWAAGPHLVAAAAGHLAARRGHYVEWGHHVPEERRRLAPLPTRSPLWKTPVAVAINWPGPWERADPRAREPLAAALARLSWMPGITRVAVSRARVGVAHARRLAAVHRGPELWLEACTLEPGALAALAARGGWERVMLDGCTLPPGELAAFAGRDELLMVSLSGAAGAAGQFAAFAGSPGLLFVDADRTTVGDADVRALAACPNLRRVSLGDAAVTGAGAAALLAGAPSLRELNLAGTAVTDAAFLGTAELPDLADLNLARTAVTDATVRALAARCPDLASLDLSHTAVTDAALPHLARLTALRVLDLTDTRVTAAALHPAIEWAALEHLSVSAAIVPPPAPLRGWHRYAEHGPKVTFGPPR